MENKIKNRNYTIKEIIESQNLSKIDSIFFKRFVLIPIAWPITWLCLKLNITANQATLLRLFFFLIAIVLVTLSYNYLGFFFLYLNLVFDYVDGQISRVSDTASFQGKFFDGLLDTITGVAFPLVIALAVYKNSDDITVIIFGFLCVYFNFSYLYLIIRYSFFLELTKHKKNIKSSSLVKYIEEKMLLDWNDFKYSTFIIFCLFKAEVYFVYMCFFVNFIFFFLLFFIKIIKATKILNIHRKSKSQK